MRIFIIILLLFAFTQNAFANAKIQLEKVNNTDTHKSNFKSSKTTVLNKDNLKEEETLKNPTNYQYDEDNYHYDKYQKFIQDNVEYSQSGRMKY